MNLPHLVICDKILFDNFVTLGGVNSRIDLLTPPACGRQVFVSQAFIK